MKKKYECSYPEWAFAVVMSRMYTVAHDPKRNLAKKIAVGSVLAFFLLISLSNFVHSSFGYMIWISLGGIFYGLLKLSQVHTVNKQILGDTITYVSTDMEGIYINTSNTVENMVFVPWTNINDVVFDFTTHAPRHLGARLQAYADWIPGVQVLTSWHAPDPDLAFSLYFNPKGQNPMQRSLSSVQIPKSWLTNETFKELCRDIEQYINVEPRNYNDLNVGVFQNEDWADKNNQLINTYFTEFTK